MFGWCLCCVSPLFSDLLSANAVTVSSQMERPLRTQERKSRNFWATAQEHPSNFVYETVTVCLRMGLGGWVSLWKAELRSCRGGWAEEEASVVADVVDTRRSPPCCADSRSLVVQPPKRQTKHVSFVKSRKRQTFLINIWIEMSSNERSKHSESPPISVLLGLSTYLD